MEGVIGYTTLFAGNFAPKAWAFCNGQIMPISTNTALFSILGTTYGGNGKTTFALPDLRGRVVVGAGEAPGLPPYSIGMVGGSQSATMSSLQMAAHTHPMQVSLTPQASTSGSTSSPSNGVYGTSAENLYSGSADIFMKPFSANLATGVTGGGQPFSTICPVLALNYIICLQGVFPARN